MFDSSKSLISRLADTTDLLLDFATLGEYGLEPVGRTPEGCDARYRAANRANPARDDLRRGPHYEEPAATYSPRRLPSKYHRR